MSDLLRTLGGPLYSSKYNFPEAMHAESQNS
jgi:hypothetical protein